MSLAIVDARQWQNLFDLKTGKKIQDDRAQASLVCDVLRRHPYPGDIESASNRWVTETALDLAGRYEPDLACLMYSHQFFAGRFTTMSEDQRKKMLAEVFAEVEAFVKETGYTPVIVGSGDMIEAAGEIDLSKLDGVAISSHWSVRYAGLHRASAKDLDYISSLPQVERIVKREEWIRMFPGIEHNPARIPEYLLVAREGWTFLTTGVPLRRAVRIPGPAYSVPVATPLGKPDTITGLRSLIDAGLKNSRIALVIIEGVGVSDFQIAHTPCSNSVDWFYYEPGDGLYLTMCTGKHQVFAYPTGYQYHDELDDKRDFPFSGYFLDVPDHTLGADFPGKSIAVGNHSMFAHMIFGADLSIECFARNLYNQGCLGVVHRHKGSFDCRGSALGS